MKRFQFYGKFLILGALLLTVNPLYLSAVDKKMIRIATVHAGAEVAGLAVNDLGELFFNSQHPAGKGEVVEGGPAAEIGYISGMDIRSYSGRSVSIPGDSEKDRVHVAAGKFVILGRSGEKLGDGNLLGGVYDAKGQLMYISNDVDYNAFIPLSSSEAYLYTAFEGASRKAVSAISRLKLQRKNGFWQTNYDESEMIDLRSIDGGWILCYGEITPWGTPLLAEEYYFYNTALWNHPDLHDEDEKPSFMKGNDMVYHMPKMMNRYLGRVSNPYRYGQMIEMNYPASDNPELVRHFSMGRFSHENATVMPDGRTVYLTDDDTVKYTNAKWNTNSGGVLFKFIADQKMDLSSGTLYAAKAIQDAATQPDKTGFDLEWIKLAHGNNEQIERWVSEYDGIGPKDYVEGQSNFVSDEDVQNWAESKAYKDLDGNGKVGSYKDDRPAFLESRKAAASLGATYEWNKLEGITNVNGTVYMAVSEITESMDRKWGHALWSTGKKDTQAQGHIKLDKEGCGVVYRGIMDQSYNMIRLEPEVVGKTTDGKKRCDDNTIAHPDNILGLSNGSLLIAEDAGKSAHPVDMLWLRK
jgi:hypothetical protein|tara:strand:- start:330 stop:2072 length:1743 start_codon:yes stop_codon:yes gene_type:complete